jgi:hypothetical protein
MPVSRLVLVLLDLILVVELQETVTVRKFLSRECKVTKCMKICRFRKMFF